jgi:dienelactone hydrolase
LAGLVVTGDAEGPEGARWTLRTTLDGVFLDIQGVLLKPAGSGPFPAVIISHGLEQGPYDYSLAIAREMRGWGLVCIGPGYTHATGITTGSPGGTADNGASDANVQRAFGARAVLRSLSYVDTSRLVAHGHSAGAFVTTALLAAAPSDFRAASHTAGGTSDDTSRTRTKPPSEATTTTVRTPYQVHHGDRDASVPLAFDERLQAILRSQGVPVELVVYAGGTHDSVEQSGEVLDRIRAWYARYSVVTSR